MAADNEPMLHRHKHHLRLPLIGFIAILCIILLAGGSMFYLQNKAYLQQKIIETGEQPFQVDHLLFKVLLKERESMQQDIRILNTADQEQEFSLSIEGVDDIVSIEEHAFSLKPQSTKAITATFSAAEQSTGVERQPGVYAGMFQVSSSSTQNIPLIVEIESSKVLFDTNLNPVALESKVDRGKDFVIEVRLFNLQTTDAENVDMRYAVKDMNGNTLLTEHETVVVKTQASFFKTISLPSSLNPGPYVFSAESSVGGSVGTSSYLFEVVDPNIEQSASLQAFCSNDPLCAGLSIAALVLLLSIAAYFYLFVGAFFYQKMSRIFSPQAALGKQQHEKSRLAEFMEEWRRNRAQRQQQQEKLQKEREKLRIEEMKRQQEEAERKRTEEERRQKEQQKQNRIEELRQQKEEEKKKKENKRQAALEEAKRLQEEQQQKEQQRLALKEIARKERLENARKLTEHKLQEQQEAKRTRDLLESKKLSIEKKRVSMAFLKMILFGRKQGGPIKAITKSTSILELQKLLDQGDAEIKNGKLIEGRTTYEKILKRYNALSIAEKKGAYSLITSFYNKLVEAENKHHKHEKLEQQQPLLVRLGITKSLAEREKERKEREAQAEKQKKLEEEKLKQQKKEQLKIEKQQHAEQKKQQQQEKKLEQLRLQEQKKQTEEQRKKELLHQKELHKAEQERKKQETEKKNQEMARRKLIEEEQHKRQAEVEEQERLRAKMARDRETASRQRESRIKETEKLISSLSQQSLELSQHISTFIRDLIAINESLKSERGKRRTPLEKKFRHLQERIIKLEQQRTKAENSLLHKQKSLLSMEGGAVNSIKLLFLPTSYRPRPLQLPPLAQPHPSKNQQSQAQENNAQPKSKAAEAQPEQQSIVKQPSKEELAKKSRAYRKYKEQIMLAEQAANKGSTKEAHAAYLKARELYLQLEYADRTEVYDELNKVYTRLSR